MDLIKTNDSGIQSLRGFSYQIKVFVYYMSKMMSNMQIEFETVEDVVVKSSIDEHSDSFRSLLKKEDSYYAIQVKQTSIDNDSKKKILYNWLLLEADSANIVSYILFTDDTYNNSDSLFEIDVENLFLIIQRSNKRGNALVSKVKKIYGNNFENFSKAYCNIKEKYMFVSEQDIDNKIFNEFSVIFHKEGVSELVYAARIKEMAQTITYEILTVICRKTPYRLTYKSMLQKIEDICDRIKNDRFEPDYTVFRKNNKINLSDQIIANSREYRQLLACNLKISRLEEHLIYLQYYESIRYRYLEDNKLNYVEDIERTTYDNFCDVKELLEQENSDSPYQRLNKTKEKQNFYVPKNQTRYGSCIYLTKELIEEDMKISWAEDES